MKPIITVFECSPDKGMGMARDMRVRWALEEVGQPYDVRTVSMKGLKEPAHRARNPFGSIPTYELGDLTLFESGSILLHIAENHEGLLPSNADARARAITWMFAALNTVEPPVMERGAASIFEKDKSWGDEHMSMINEQLRSRLGDLSEQLGDSEWINGAFSAADILMVQVLRWLDDSGLVEQFPNLKAYVARGEARPAFKRAYAAQQAVFENASAN